MVEYKRLIPSTILGTTAAAIFTNTSGESNYFKVFIIHNYSSSSATVTLWDGTNSDGNQFMKVAIESDETIFIEIKGSGIVTTGTETIYAKCSAGTTCNIRAFGGNE